VNKLNIPIVEAYIGEYASGKSENAVNRALWLANQGRKVTLADLDIVEPFYTLRPIKEKLESKGIEVIAWESSQTMGLGEAGNVIKPELRWVLKKPGDIILDVGYGVEGAKTLNIIPGAYENPYLKIIVVINTSRPMTSTVEDIVEYVKSLGRVDGIVNNTNIDIIQNGAKLIKEASTILKVPVLFTSAEVSHQKKLGKRDIVGNPVFYIERYMPETFW
jgi:hypothetical protein